MPVDTSAIHVTLLGSRNLGGAPTRLLPGSPGINLRVPPRVRLDHITGRAIPWNSGDSDSDLDSD